MPINHDLLPNLKPGAYRIMSPEATQYNGIAGAAGISEEWWDPAMGYPWPADLPHDVSVETLGKVYERCGFVVCDNAELEHGLEKIAIYGAS